MQIRLFYLIKYSSVLTLRAKSCQRHDDDDTDDKLSNSYLFYSLFGILIS